MARGCAAFAPHALSPARGAFSVIRVLPSNFPKSRSRLRAAALPPSNVALACAWCVSFSTVFEKSALACAWCPNLAEFRSRLRAVRLRSRLRGVAIFVLYSALACAAWPFGSLLFLDFFKSELSPARGPQFGWVTRLIMIIITIIIIIISITTEGPVV